MKKVDSKKLAAVLLVKLVQWERRVSRMKTAPRAARRHAKTIKYILEV